MRDRPVVLAVDGNSLVHRAFHAHARSGLRDAHGRPIWAIQGLLQQVLSAVDRSCADAVVVGFDDPDLSVRRDRWPDYKAQRPDKLANLDAQLRLAPEVIADLGLPVVVPRGLEADDVLASVAAAANGWGARAVLATSDRDAFALIDENTSVLRLINGGAAGSPMLTPERLEILVGVRPDQYRDLAALRGDPADNLPGVSGVGKVTGARLLQTFGSGRALFEAVASDSAAVRAVVGPALTARLAQPEAEQAWRRNVEIMTMHADVPLDAEATRKALPLQSAPVETIYARFDLPVRQAVRSLCGVEVARAPEPRDVGIAGDARALRYQVHRRSQPAVARQLTLFT